MTRQIVLDTETTGLSAEKGHRLIEVGCVEMINRRITENYFHVYVNPDRVIEEGAIRVHGITNEFLKDKPKFSHIAESLFAYLQGAELIIHNAAFDLSFLNSEFTRIQKKWAPLTNHCNVIDTLAMARREHPGQQNTLDALCKRYSVDNTNRELHGALLDARLLANVYLRMTGGQTQLFSEETPEVVFAAEKNDVANRAAHTDLVLLAADEMEMQLHKRFVRQHIDK